MRVKSTEDAFSHLANRLSFYGIVCPCNRESAGTLASVCQEAQFKVPIFVRSHHATNLSLPTSLGAESREVKLTQVRPPKNIVFEHTHYFAIRL